MQQQMDKIYVKQVLQGDVSQYAKLIEKYKDRVFSMVHRMVGNNEDAEEITQDVFIKSYESLSSFRGDSAFSTWIYRIAYNTAISTLRKNSRDRKNVHIDAYDLGDIEIQTVQSEFHKLQKQDQKKYIGLALQQIDETDAALIELYYYQDLFVNEIVEITGLTESNIKVKLHRSRAKIYSLLKGLLNDEIKSLV